MSAGFKISEQVFWGTNGAIEVYIEAIAQQAAIRFGTDDRMAAFFREERAGFFMGKVISLDTLLLDATSCRHFLEVLNVATEQLFERDIFSEYGRVWLWDTARELRAHVSDCLARFTEQ